MTEPAAGRRRLSTDIADALVERIRNGDFPEGSALPSERDLCVQFGVGRPTVREAMIHLESRGYIDSSAGRRPRMQEPSLDHLFARLSSLAGQFMRTPEGFGHLEQARMLLETGVVRYAVDHATPAQISALHAALKACEAQIDTDEPFRKADVAFHRVLAEVPGNPIIVAVHDAVVEWLIERRPARKDVEAVNRMSQAEHQEVFDAVVRRNKQQAEDAMIRHLNRAYCMYFLPDGGAPGPVAPRGTA